MSDMKNLINMISNTLSEKDTKEHLLNKLQHEEDTTANAPTKTSTLSAFDINKKYDEVDAMSLKHDIAFEKILRGYKVTIGHEELLFHDQEYNHMVNVLCTYIINPEPLHNIVQNAKRWDAFEDVTKSNEPPCVFHIGNKLIITKGRKGYSLSIGNQRKCYVSTSLELAKEMYNVLTQNQATT